MLLPSDDLIFEGECIQVMLLPDNDDVVTEWATTDNKKFLQAFGAMDSEVTGPARRWRGDRATKVEQLNGGPLWEVRAPVRGNRIYRALCFNPRGYDLYVAFASEKKSQSLPNQWIELAATRVAACQQKGLL